MFHFFCCCWPIPTLDSHVLFLQPLLRSHYNNLYQKVPHNNHLWKCPSPRSIQTLSRYPFSIMGLSPPVFVVLIVLATVVPPLIAGVLLSRFVCRDFRDAAGAVKSRPQRRCFGLRRVRSADSTAAKSLATRAQSYADSWQDLESLRTYRDTPTPSLQYCTCEQALPTGGPTSSTIQIQQPPETWHPSRASRLTWSFSPTRRNPSDLQKSHSRLEFSRDSGVAMEGSIEEERGTGEGRALRRTRV